MELNHLPADPEEQVACAVEIIQNAFALRNKTYHDELREEKLAYEEKAAQLTERCESLERQNREQVRQCDELRLDFSRREDELNHELRVLRQELARLEKEAVQWQNLRRLVLESLRTDDVDDNGAPGGATGGAAAASAFLHAAGTKAGAASQSLLCTPVVSRFAACAFPSGGAVGGSSVRRSESLRPAGTYRGASSSPRRSLRDVTDTRRSESDNEGHRLFANARKSLSADAMSQLLDCVNRLNSGKVPVDVALHEVERLCGYDNAFVYHQFKNLLDKQMRKAAPGPPREQLRFSDDDPARPYKQSDGNGPATAPLETMTTTATAAGFPQRGAAAPAFR